MADDLQLLTRRLSGTWKSRTLSICVPFFSSISSSFWACTTVRGNPSSTKPTRHSGRLTASSMRPTTRSSETSAPAFIAFSACTVALHKIEVVSIHGCSEFAIHICFQCYVAHLSEVVERVSRILAGNSILAPRQVEPDVYTLYMTGQHDGSNTDLPSRQTVVMLAP